MTTHRTEEYLETIYKLEERGDKPTVSGIAAYLSISAASVSEMVKKLQSEDLLDLDSKRIGFTEKGKSTALKVVRRHRLSERLLTDMLGVFWTDSHDQACELEHVINQDLEDRIEKNLGFPSTCPHGYPIPGNDGVVADLGTTKLSELQEGHSGVVSSVPEEDAGVLMYLENAGIRPEAKVSCLGAVPYSDTINFRVNDGDIALSRSIAEKIRVS